MPEIGSYQDGSSKSGAVLPLGEHAVRLASVRLKDGRNFNTGATEDNWEFVFESVNRVSADGRAEVCTVWTNVNYGHDKAKLTLLMDQIFGRRLTREEYKNLDFDRMVGMPGYVMVMPHKKQDGTASTKFGAFRHPDGKTPPSPAEFANITTHAGPQAPVHQPAPIPQPTNPAPFPAVPPQGEIPNPWGAANTNGTGANAPF